VVLLIIREYDKANVDRPFTLVLSRKQKQQVRKNLQIGKPPPYKTRSQGGSTSSDQWTFLIGMTRRVLCWSLKTGHWFQFCSVIVGTMLAIKESKLSLRKETVALIYLLIWVIRYKAHLGSRCCLRFFRLTPFWIGVGSLALGSRSQVFPFFFLFLFPFSFFFSFFRCFFFVFLRVLA